MTQHSDDQLPLHGCSQKRSRKLNPQTGAAAFQAILVTGLLLLVWGLPTMFARAAPEAVASPTPYIVGEIRAFAFDPTGEPGHSAYMKLADQGWMECKGRGA